MLHKGRGNVVPLVLKELCRSQEAHNNVSEQWFCNSKVSLFHRLFFEHPEHARTAVWSTQSFSLRAQSQMR